MKNLVGSEACAVNDIKISTAAALVRDIKDSFSSRLKYKPYTWTDRSRNTLSSWKSKASLYSM